jgi:hypothetical protein
MQKKSAVQIKPLQASSETKRKWEFNSSRKHKHRTSLEMFDIRSVGSTEIFNIFFNYL